MVESWHGPATPHLTRDPRLKEGWRAAAAAYRRVYGEPQEFGRGNADRAMAAALAALHATVPDLSDRDATLEAIAAVSFASRAHPEWLYALHRPAARKS
ncbi:hypothetical protein [Hyphomicrobium sp. 99]|uniref:hypothetical protein n=1 Tax=Hyphomicrobium sp. 99 TaxID=1163419 RepID=UPI0012E06ACB|nr:hypothetical protein [Hyphomicrobium sp. 99]